jgi:anti-sigma factor RsiW
VAERTFAGLRCSDAAELAPAFVLGALEAVESDQVRRHLAECPEAHAEFAELHSVIPALLASVEPVAPPAGLKDRILAAAAGERTHADATPAAPEAPAAPAPVARPEPRPAARPEPVDRGGWGNLFRRPVWAAVSLAAAIAVVALGAWNVQLQNDVASLTAYRNGVVEVLRQAAEPGAQLAVLVPPEGSGPSGLAAVGADGKVAIVVRDLAPTSGTQVYEAWLIAGTAPPVPIGGFAVVGTGSASFTAAHAPLGPGVVVALTLEDGPGAQTPKLPIIVSGAATAQAS